MEAEMGRGEAATSGDPLPDGLRPSPLSGTTCELDTHCLLACYPPDLLLPSHHQLTTIRWQ